MDLELTLQFDIHDNNPRSYQLIADPRTNINFNENVVGDTFLHTVIKIGNMDVLKCLLKRSDLDPNIRNVYGDTPLHTACRIPSSKQKTINSMIYQLIQDPRVRVDITDYLDKFPIEIAYSSHETRRTEMLLAYRGSEITIPNISDTRDTGLTRFIARYRKDPQLGQFTLKRRWQIPSGNIATLFGTVVMFTDGYYRLKSVDSNNKYHRWFQMMKQFPMDLQMVICNRCFGSFRNIVSTKETELALKSLVQFPNLKLA